MAEILQRLSWAGSTAGDNMTGHAGKRGANQPPPAPNVESRSAVRRGFPSPGAREARPSGGTDLASRPSRCKPAASASDRETPHAADLQP
ncbi:hypothetical protein [Ancylobacter oerskovii]|uniref:Uncharacterized protein n=1 Tax=Ancylobacter oerskovii TaxID=459519 RepID=A0ABW4YS35_9HYPH